MPWTEGYMTAGEHSQEARWPQEADCCASLVIDYSVPTGTDGMTEAALNTAKSLFGECVSGEWMLDMLGTIGVKATWAVSPMMARAFPEVVARAAREGHEIAMGGLDKRDTSKMDRQEEGRAIEDAHNEVAGIAGTAPRGWYSLPRTADDHPGGIVSPHTFSLLRDAGFLYFGNGMADDIPYYTAIGSPEKAMLTLPYYYAFDSQYFLFFPGIGKGSGIVNIRKLANNWNGELEAALHYHRQVTLFVQPCLVYWGMARRVLEEILRRFVSDRRIWQATSAQCAEYWLAAYPEGSFRPA